MEGMEGRNLRYESLAIPEASKPDGKLCIRS